MRDCSSIIGMSLMLAVSVSQVTAQSRLDQPTPSAVLEGVGIDFLQDSPFFLTWRVSRGSPQRTLGIWRIEGWTLEKQVTFRTGANYRVNVLPKSEILITAQDLETDDRRQYIMSIPDGTTRRLENLISSSVYSSDRLLCAYRPLDADGRPNHARIILERVDSGEIVLDFVPYRLRSHVVGFSPDSRFLVYDGDNHPLRKKYSSEVRRELEDEPPFRLWDIEANREDRRKIPGKHRSRFVGFTSDGKRLIIAGSRILVADFATGRVLAQYNQVGVLQTVAKSPDGRLLAFRSNKKATLWDHQQGTAASWACHEYGPKRLLFSPDGKWLATNGPLDATLFVWSTESLIPLMRNLASEGDSGER